GRSLPHLISVITDLERRGDVFRSLSEAIDTSTAPGRLMFHVLGALAEFERSLFVDGLKCRQARY
ncbi:recombinase family protein, partial [Hyphomicrobium sp.]|uniref:recombinase family protein n=1 Tax=Hyphomicrobium sp. TaxID=82 RepID=UPI002C029148